jgi:hypothetical protein
MHAPAFTPQDLAEIQAIAADLDELRRENPMAFLPDSAERVFIAERMGLLWDFDEGRWLPDGDGLALAYRPTPAALALLQSEEVA